MVYGHTHEPLLVPVSMTKYPEGKKGQMCPDTVTWGKRFHT